MSCTEKRPEAARVSLFSNTDHLLIEAVIQESNLEAHFTTRDTTIHKEDCLEIFLDPLADGKDYYEIQVNALGTIADLKLLSSEGNVNKPSNMVPWNIAQENVEVKYNGTINDASDKDESWSVKIRVPWALISEGRPLTGDIWAYNLMIVDHYTEGVDHWVVSPTGRRYIHVPEKWSKHTF